MYALKNIVAFIKESQSKKLTLIAIIISLVLLTILFSLVDIEKIIIELAEVDLRYISISFFIFLLSILVVSLRLIFVLHLSVKENLFSSLDLSVIHTVLLCLLPARMGDVCYPFLLNKILKVNISRSLLNIIILRLYDFIVSAILFLSATMVITIDLPDKLLLQNISIVLILITFIILISMKYVFSIININDRKKNNNVWINNIIEIFRQIQEGFLTISLIDHFILFSMTLIKWILSISVMFLIFLGLNMKINIVETILVITGMNFVVALPIQTIGGFGLVETSLAFLLGLVGYASSEAILFALSARFIWLMMPLLLGVLWLIGRRSYNGN